MAPRDSLLIDSAVTIGRILCGRAVWLDGGTSCCWEEPSPIDGQSSRAPWRAGDLYAGTAGVGLFLAQLHRIAPEPAFARTALGCLTNAMAWQQHVTGPATVSAFSGTLGIIYAAHHARHLLEEDAPAKSSWQLHELALRAANLAGERSLLDFMAGTAGAILVLLSLRQATDDHRLLEVATRLGETLCDRADWSEAYCAWDTWEATGLKALPLSGLAHGASGMAYALLKLFEATGREDFLMTARGAYAYEDSLFDPGLCNWLDMRFVESVEEARAKQSAVVAWCHGAGGIALSRMQAAVLDPENAQYHRTAMEIGARATLAKLAEAESQDRYDVTPCHGLLGLAEILAMLDAALPGMGLRQAALSAASRTIETYGAAQDWPRETPDRKPEASLLTGSAGVGYTFLRLVRPDLVPSVLLLM